MAKNITLVRGDDTNFFDQVLLVVSFKTVLNLDGYKLRLTVENPTNIMKQYEIQQNAVQIDFSKIDSSTFSVGEHRANLKLIDTLGRVKTTHTFNITVQDEFEANIPKINEYEIELELDTDGINKYKNYKELSNKPSINGVELIDDKSLDELGIQPAGNYSTYEYVDGRFDTVNTEINNINIDIDTKANISDIPTRVSQLVNDEGYLTEHQDISNKADIDYVEELLDRKSDKSDTYTKVDVNSLLDEKQDVLIAGDNIFIDESNTISAIVPSIEGLATKQELQQGLNTKQPVGEYLTEIPEEYVKNTDYASSKEGGIIKIDSSFGTQITSAGYMHAYTENLTKYTQRNGNFVIGKGTLENIKDDYVKRAVTENMIELSDDEKASAKQWLGFATPAEIMQAIASIPQFSISLVESLPETGEKMVLYLVSKGGESPDVYDEYIWIEQTSSFEFLGTTAPDLTGYVKNTDYATSTTGGIIKANTVFGCKMANGNFVPDKATLAVYTVKGENFWVGKGTLENIKNDLVKRAVTENDIELTADEQTNARTWLGAVGKEDYATTSKAGVIKDYSNGGFSVSSVGLPFSKTFSLSLYNTVNNTIFISKGTLDNVLTQYSKTVPITQSDYEALETKDANTLYLIEE